MGERNQRNGAIEKIRLKRRKTENSESVIGSPKNTLTTRFRTAWDLSEITLKPKYKNTTREISLPVLSQNTGDGKAENKQEWRRLE